MDVTTVRRRLRGALPVPVSEAMLLAIMVEHDLSPGRAHQVLRKWGYGAMLDKPPGKDAPEEASV